MKSLICFTQALLQDLGRVCCVSTEMDLKTISSRTKMEGMSFLTITLPTFSKSLERALAEGSLASFSNAAFRRKPGTYLPVFLQGFMARIFDPCTGQLRTDACPDAVKAIRQISLLFKKYEADCTEQRQRHSLEEFVLCDEEVRHHAKAIPDHHLEAFADVAKQIFSPVLDVVEDLLKDPHWLIPRHGPGTTQDRTLANAKYDYLRWTRRLEQSGIHAADHLLPNMGFDDRFLDIDFLEPSAEPPVRVVLVPKTLKSPRVIAIEPVHMQYVQQALMDRLVPALEGWHMYGSLGFTDQTPNQRLAEKGSIDGSVATLDLSEASDRVSWLLVQKMLSHWPRLLTAVSACRSQRAEVPGYGIISLSKFASMGSALCFPIEAMVFLTILGCERIVSTGSSRLENRKAFLSSVRVYGDDIIVPTDHGATVARSLEVFGLKVNQHKSFWTGKFRESCGADFFLGETVKPVYLKRNFPTSRRNVSEWESTVSLRNHLYRNGYWEACKFLDRLLEGIAPFPVVSDRSAVLGRHSVFTPKGGKMCDRLHKPLVLGLVPSRKAPVSPITGEGALMKFFLKRGDEPIFAKDHLERAGRPKSANIRLRWAPAD